MLRLNRKKGQTILMQTPQGEMIEVQVLDCGGGQVHLGIEAPRGIEVWRAELFHIVMENRKAAQAVPTPAQLLQQLQTTETPDENETYCNEK